MKGNGVKCFARCDSRALFLNRNWMKKKCVRVPFVNIYLIKILYVVYYQYFQLFFFSFFKEGM